MTEGNYKLWWAVFALAFLACLDSLGHHLIHVLVSELSHK